MRESSCCCEQQNTNKTSHKILLIKFDSSYHNRPKKYFNPRSPCGERLLVSSLKTTALLFQSTLPVWGATIYLRIRYLAQQFQSTLPVWGATHYTTCTACCLDISIHAPRVGSDAGYNEDVAALAVFQSTLPVWGATLIRIAYTARLTHFNPRSPCGERRTPRSQHQNGQEISIHAPRVGSDVILASIFTKFFLFQSTLPVWGATFITCFCQQNTARFQSTLPVWGATRLGKKLYNPMTISIHAPRVGSDLGVRSMSSPSASGFQSTLPVWGATVTGYCTRQFIA